MAINSQQIVQVLINKVRVGTLTHHEMHVVSVLSDTPCHGCEKQQLGRIVKLQREVTLI